MDATVTPSSTPLRASLTLAALALCACGEGSPLMSPGEDCVACHDTLTVAGTVFPSASSPADAGLAGVEVLVTDAAGAQVRLTSNDAGNFFTHARVTLPLRRAEVRRGGQVLVMDGGPGGACNGCHAPGGVAGAPGRLFAP